MRPDPWETVGQSGFHARQRLFNLLNTAVFFRDSRGELIAYAEKKAFKLKEDLRVYSSEERTEEILIIRAQNVIDFSGTYDVLDPLEDEYVGAIRRRGIESLVRDTWEILGPEGDMIGQIREDSTALALLRRFIGSLIPQRLDFHLGERLAATYRGHFNPFIFKGDYEPTVDAESGIDPRLALASVMLYLCLEGRQN